MESAVRFMTVLASSSLWLTGAGVVLWLCLRRRPRLSPGAAPRIEFILAVFSQSGFEDDSSVAQNASLIGDHGL